MVVVLLAGTLSGVCVLALARVSIHILYPLPLLGAERQLAWQTVFPGRILCFWNWILTPGVLLRLPSRLWAGYCVSHTSVPGEDSPALNLVITWQQPTAYPSDERYQKRIYIYIIYTPKIHCSPNSMTLTWV